MQAHKIIIAIDGHSSCGKSTFAKSIASRLDILYIDSGAMYRAVTLACLRKGLISGEEIDKKGLFTLLGNIEITFRKKAGSPNSDTFLNGENVEEAIRSLKVASSVSIVSKYKEVREKLVALQRELGKSRGIVMDGRDIGTVVFPEADIKIFMTAKPEIRAERRFRELNEQGRNVNYDEVLDNITTRDEIDENRRESPLSKAPDAIVLDNSYMSPHEQMIWFDRLLGKMEIT